MDQTVLKEDRQFGVDSRWSWVTAGFLSWYLSMALITVPSLSVLFYGIIHEFGVTREEAAWPLVLCASLGYLAGPIMGYLCHRFSCQSMLLVGSVAAAASQSACGFARSIPQLIVLHGVVNGLAMSCIIVTVNVLVSQHFEKRRTTACSLKFFFCGLNMVFAPPLAELFRSTYGTRGTFLLLGGLTLNSLPAAIVLRSPHWMNQRGHSVVTKDCTIRSNAAADTTEELPKTDGLAINDEAGPGEAVKPLLSLSSPQNVQAAIILPLSSRLQGWKSGCRRAFSLLPRQLWTLAFAVNALSFAVIMFGISTFLLVLMDIASDRNLAPSRAVLLVNAFGIGDLVLRPLSGLVIDSGILSLEAVMFLGFLLQAITFEIFAWLRTFPTMLACSVLVGISNGSRVSLQAPALVKDFGIHSLPILIGAASFVCGVVISTRPFLFGYCRDQLGSYDLLLHGMATANLIFFFVWMAKYFVSTRTRQ